MVLDMQVLSPVRGIKKRVTMTSSGRVGSVAGVSGGKTNQDLRKPKSGGIRRGSNDKTFRKVFRTT